MAFEYYVTDALKGIGDVLLKYFNHDNSVVMMSQRYADLFNTHKDTRTAEEVASDIIAKAGLKVIMK